MSELPAAASKAAEAIRKMQDWAESHARWRTSACINLIAANNVMSPSARAVLSSRLADKPISGTLGSRHHMGGRYVDLIETTVVELARELFGATTVEYRPMSGNLANAAATHSTTRPGDTMLVLPIGAPCHHSHRVYAQYRGLRLVDIPYDYERFDVDLDGLREAARAERPRMIVLGTALMLFPYRLAEIRAIADEVGALVMYDGAHPMGLIAGGQFQDPLAEGAHILIGSTQKTLPGPIGGLVLTRDESLGQTIAMASGRLMSNYHNNRVLALGITLAEMLAFGKEYAAACIANAQTLAKALAEGGIPLVGARRGFSRSNQVIVDLSAREGDAERLAHSWEAANLMTTVVSVPSPTLRAGQPPDGVRIGVQEVTRLGMGTEEIKAIAGFLVRAAQGEDPAVVGGEAAELAAQFQQPRYCFEAAT